MRPVFKNPIRSSSWKINQSHSLSLVFGPIKKPNWLSKSVFFKGSFLGFSFWYTVNLYSFFLNKFFIAPHSVRPLFFNLIIDQKKK